MSNSVRNDPRALRYIGISVPLRLQYIFQSEITAAHVHRGIPKAILSSINYFLNNVKMMPFHLQIICLLEIILKSF